MRRPALALLVSIALALSAAASAGDSTRILGTKLAEERPVAGGGYIAWAQNSRKNPRLLKVYARFGSEKPFLVSRQYQGIPGGIDGTTLVYQEYSTNLGSSYIRFYDLRERKHLATPDGVNTSQWEWRPSVSGKWLLFSRNDDSWIERVFLFNIETKKSIQLDRWRLADDSNYGFTGQVNGNYAVWDRCPYRDKPCVVVRYDISTGKKTVIKPPAGFLHFSPSVAPDGTTYLVRGEFGCGALVELRRYPVTGPPTRVFGPLPIGATLWTTFVESRQAPSGPVNDVYYDRGDCEFSWADVWRHSDAPKQRN